MDDVCNQHSGFKSDIASLKHDDMLQWRKINQMDEKIDEMKSTTQTKINDIKSSILNRVNLTLWSMIVACILLVIDIYLRQK